MFGVEMKLVDDRGNALPHDGKAVGELLVRGPWIVSGYFEDEEATARRGRARRLVPHRRCRDDRPRRLSADHATARKDVIKSGGEWISSIDLENAAMAA